MKQVFPIRWGVIHGMGLADVRRIRERAVEAELSQGLVRRWGNQLVELEAEELNRTDAESTEEEELRFFEGASGGMKERIRR